MHQIPDGRFAQIKEEAERYYKSIGDIYCPYFSKTVSFNARGLHHIEFKDRRTVRGKADQYVRLRLLQLAPEIIRISHTLQGMRETYCEVSEHSKGRWKRSVKRVTYYEFVHIKRGARVRILVKQIEGGDLYFWSIIPFWRQALGKKVLYSGDPEKD